MHAAEMMLWTAGKNAEKIPTNLLEGTSQVLQSLLGQVVKEEMEHLLRVWIDDERGYGGKILLDKRELISNM